MTAQTHQEAYALYKRHGVESGDALAPGEFADLWRVLSQDDQEFWIERFEQGPTKLSRDFVLNIEKFDPDEDVLSLEVRAQLDQYLQHDRVD